MLCPTDGKNFSPTLITMTPNLTLAPTTLTATRIRTTLSLLRRPRPPPRSARPMMRLRRLLRRPRPRMLPLRALPSSLATSAGRLTTTFSTRSSRAARVSLARVSFPKTDVPEVSVTSTSTARIMRRLLLTRSRVPSWTVVT